MTPLAVGVILACVVALTLVLISTLLSVRKTALRAESVLAQVEREIRPMASEIESLTGELQKLSHNANDNLQRIGGIVDRVEDISMQVGAGGRRGGGAHAHRAVRGDGGRGEAGRRGLPSPAQGATPLIGTAKEKTMADERGSDAAGYLGWFFLGAIAGAAAAVLLTPKTGRETRELLAEHSGDLVQARPGRGGRRRRIAPAISSTRAVSTSRSRRSG